MSRLHLADSAEPLLGVGPVTTICGEQIFRPQFVFHWDGDLPLDFAEFVQNSLSVCRKCREVEIEGRYVYGVNEGIRQKEEQA